MKKQFKDLIAIRGFNVQSLAIKSGVDRNTIYSLGRGANIHMGTIIKVGQALEVSTLVIIALCYSESGSRPNFEGAAELVEKLDAGKVEEVV